MPNTVRHSVYGKSSDSMCCCEYIDRNGKSNHLLACCCDCEALDSLCDQLIRCEKINNSSLIDMFATIEDRMRIPSCTGKGATKVHLDVALPTIIIPTGILIGTIHPALTCLSLVFMPLSLITCYRIWLGMTKKPRTQIFFAWGLVSVAQMLITFEFVVVPYREVLLWENLLLLTICGMMLYALYNIRTNTGFLPSRPHDMDFNNTENDDERSENNFTTNDDPISMSESYHSQNEKEQRDAMTSSSQLPHPSEDNIKQFGAVGALLIENIGMDKSFLEQNVEERKREMRLMQYVTPRQFVTHVDSRMTTTGAINRWCDACNIEKPARAGHCKVCRHCVHCRDHHCVWVDCCIGGHNHRSFIAGISLFLVGAIYGVHLSLTTICTPQQYHGFFLYPADCSNMYADFPTALVFVSSLYTLIAVTGMLLVLLSQCNLISHNITTEEMYKAGLRGWSCCLGFAPTHHVLDAGLLRNWYGFLSGSRARQHSYDTVGKKGAGGHCQGACNC